MMNYIGPGNDYFKYFQEASLWSWELGITLG